jgi:hypothetical protein
MISRIIRVTLAALWMASIGPVASAQLMSTCTEASGVEAVYVVEGEACYTTPDRAFRLKAGETLALDGGITMRAVVTGSKPRHVLAVIVHDAAQPATMRMPEGTGPPLASCQ